MSDNNIGRGQDVGELNIFWRARNVLELDILVYLDLSKSQTKLS